MADKRLYSGLKKNNFMRRLVKGIKNYLSFFGDARRFDKNYLEKASAKGDYSYTLMLLTHSVEKGLSNSDPRPFGEGKARRIFEILSNNPDKSEEFEYALAASALKEWKAFHIKNNWLIPDDLSAFIDGLKGGCPAGCSTIEPDKELLGRRSPRDFEKTRIKDEDIAFALEYFKAAPTACNRQMCRIYRVKTESLSSILNEKLLGLSGFNAESATFFVVTFDIAAFEYYGERNQGYLNAGLTSMNFVNGLHLRGIGSCFLQWSNNRKDDKLVRKKLGLEKSEAIAVVIAAGYYKEKTVAPNSVRKDISQLYREI